jgi:thiamine monophosphate kinase
VVGDIDMDEEAAFGEGVSLKPGDILMVTNKSGGAAAAAAAAGRTDTRHVRLCYYTERKVYFFWRR